MAFTNVIKLNNAAGTHSIMALILDKSLFGTGSDYPKVVNTTGINWQQATNLLSTYVLEDYMPFYLNATTKLNVDRDTETLNYFASVTRGQDRLEYNEFTPTTNKAYFCVALENNAIVKTGVLYIDGTSLAFLCAQWDDPLWMALMPEQTQYFKETIEADGYQFTDIYGEVPTVGYRAPTVNDDNALVKDAAGNPLKITDLRTNEQIAEAAQTLLSKLRVKGTNLGLICPWNVDGVERNKRFNNNSYLKTQRVADPTYIYKLTFDSANGSDLDITFARDVSMNTMLTPYVTDNPLDPELAQSVSVWLVKTPYNTSDANAKMFPIVIAQQTQMISVSETSTTLAVMRLGTSLYDLESSGFFFDPTTNTTILERKQEEQKKEEEDKHTGDSETDKTEKGEGGNIEAVTSEGDTITSTAIPSGVSSIDTGFIRMYKMTTSQMNDLATDFNDDDIIRAIGKLFETNPMDVILSFHAIPGQAPAETTPEIISFFGTSCPHAQGHKVTSEYFEIDCGSIYIEGYDSFLDYAPNTKATLYLPYIGYQQIDIDKIIWKTVSLKYMVDVASGAIMAELHDGIRIIGTWSGMAIKQYPITQANRNTLMSNVLGMATQAAVGVATGGFSIAGMASQAASAAMSMKPDISVRGGSGGSSGFMMCKIPMVILERPDQIQPSHYGEHIGYPANIEVNLSDVNGYCEFSSVHLEGITCTQEEKNIIEGYLNGGVYL